LKIQGSRLRHCFYFVRETQVVQSPDIMKKPCPACGYRDTPTERQMLYRYKKAFGDMPVMAMMKRGWLDCGFSDERGWPPVEEVADALKRFFGDEPFFNLCVCSIEP